MSDEPDELAEALFFLAREGTERIEPEVVASDVAADIADILADAIRSGALAHVGIPGVMEQPTDTVDGVTYALRLDPAMPSRCAFTYSDAGGYSVPLYRVREQ